MVAQWPKRVDDVREAIILDRVTSAGASGRKMVICESVSGSTRVYPKKRERRRFNVIAETFRKPVIGDIGLNCILFRLRHYRRQNRGGEAVEARLDSFESRAVRSSTTDLRTGFHEYLSDRNRNDVGACSTRQWMRLVAGCSVVGHYKPS